MKNLLVTLMTIAFSLPLMVNAQFTDQGTFLTTSKNVTIGANNDTYTLFVAKEKQKWQGIFSNRYNSLGTNIYLSHGLGYGMLIKTYFAGDEYSLRMQNLNGDTNNFYNNGNVELGLVGNVGIGTTNPQHKLDVCGVIRAEEILVDDTWCDFVFEQEYCLTTLEEEADFIKMYGHLSNFESAKDMNGEINVNDIFKRQQIQIEENVLHLIDINEKNQTLQLQVEDLSDEVVQLNHNVNTLTVNYETLMKELAILKKQLR